MSQKEIYQQYYKGLCPSGNASELDRKEAAAGLIWNQFTVIMMCFCLKGWHAPHVIKAQAVKAQM